jgi:penicillin-insensitive murein endopeptidase
VKLEESAFVRYTGEYRERGSFWGTWELVQLVERAAYRVARRLPGARLSVGELSAQRGGDIGDHGSHENGRDVDIAFYMVDGRGRPIEPYAFADFRADGTALPPNEGLVFDDARNWELVAKLVADGDARIQFIFVAHEIERRLLAEGVRRGAPGVVLSRAEAVMAQPSGHPHRNHFHVRIYCAPADRPACQDRPPFHPWYPAP